jgi:biotin-dependent carboxylase-like uncharacterized protein
VSTHLGIEVVGVDGLALIEDNGRPGLAHLGVPPSGAADRRAFKLGNRILANPEDAASLEVIGPLWLKALSATAICVTGADVAIELAGSPAPMNSVVHMAAGSMLTLGRTRQGLRYYVSVRGGFTADAELGSRSTDVLSGLGPAPLHAAQRLSVGPPPWALPLVDVVPVATPKADALTVHATPGPRADWFADFSTLSQVGWRVSPESNRVGIRLGADDKALVPRRTSPKIELESEGVVRGAVQLPPSGEAVVFLADYPVTGGYPVIAVIDDPDTDLLAQATAGQHVRIAWRSRH